MQKTTTLLNRLSVAGEIRITGIYLVFGALWILISDRLLFTLVKKPLLLEASVL